MTSRGRVVLRSKLRIRYNRRRPAHRPSSAEALCLRTELVADRNRTFLACNFKRTQATGSKVRRTFKSGGTERDWVGVPRSYKPSLDAVVLAAGGDPQADRCA